MSPFVIGIFLVKSTNKKRNALIKLKDEILEDVKKETKLEISELRKSHNLLDDTYFTYHKRISLVEICDSYLSNLRFLTKYLMLFNSDFVSFLNESIYTFVSLKNDFENYNNCDFIKKRMMEYDYLFKKSPFPLDKSQIISVITDDTHNLVVAGAGSGKTEVLITRIAYLVERKPDTINSERILVLAFQNKAAKEIQDRLSKRFGTDVKIKTFHSFGREIIQQAHESLGKAVPYIADDREQQNIISSVFEEEKLNKEFQNEIVNYMKTYGDTEIYKSKANFDKKREYYEYMRNLTYTALDGTKVKSEAEREILNYFITHDLNGKRVRVLYESPAEWMKYKGNDGEIKIPKPDFFFSDFNIYLEHWAIDENKKVPEWFEGENPTKKYNKGMLEKKKRFAQQSEYSLVETTHEDFKQNSFLQILENRILHVLKEKYPEDEFKFTFISYDILINRVWRECVVSVKNLPYDISKFITIAKTHNLTPHKIKQRTKDEHWSPKQKQFSRMATSIYIGYDDRLRSENKIDFSDMINIAIKYLEQKKNLYKNNFDHILVDEYQDISTQRYEFIKSLMEKNKNCKLFCVGDDWQSIMAFSGSNLDFFVNFDEYFDHPATTYLTVNYRSCKSIVDTGSEIIKNNGNTQIKKETNPINEMMMPVKVFISSYGAKSVNNYHSQVAKHCISTIDGYLQNGYEPQDIMILSRIAKNPLMINKLQEHSKYMNIPISFETTSQNKVQFMSVHKSKGLQARIVFLLNVVEGLYGFPCERENPDIFEPASKGRKKAKEEEERRLFYVAVTRAKEELVIYSQKDLESKFLEEIKDHIILKSLQK
ncbi:UvrD-helicase domain-containing protein [Methanococcoides sp. SA1]|nr:UvrD-helicase domain-containing protein [Methanococcoides sp. SA1]